MTEHELQCLLVAEREWRITELEFCKKIPFLYTYPSFRSHYPLFWKFCIPMIYSHWEGFCVASMKLLVDYLNEIDSSNSCQIPILFSYIEKINTEKYRHHLKGTEVVPDFNAY